MSITYCDPTHKRRSCDILILHGGQGPVGVRGVYIHGQLHTRGLWFGGMSKKTTGCLNRHNKFFNPKPDKSKSVQYTPDEIVMAKRYHKYQK